MISSFNLLELCRMLNSDNTDDFHLAVNILYNEGHSKQDVAEFVRYASAGRHYLIIDKDFNIEIQPVRYYGSSGMNGTAGTTGTSGYSGYVGTTSSSGTMTTIPGQIGIHDPTKTLLITPANTTSSAVPAKELEPPNLNSKKSPITFGRVLERAYLYNVTK